LKNLLAQLQKENTQPIFDIAPVHSVEPNILDALERLAGVNNFNKIRKQLHDQSGEQYDLRVRDAVFSRS
jgi:poly-D-alanine transfer protein DltD